METDGHSNEIGAARAVKLNAFGDEVSLRATVLSTELQIMGMERSDAENLICHVLLRTAVATAINNAHADGRTPRMWKWLRVCWGVFRAHSAQHAVKQFVFHIAYRLAENKFALEPSAPTDATASDTTTRSEAERP